MSDVEHKYKSFIHDTISYTLAGCTYIEQMYHRNIPGLQPTFGPFIQNLKSKCLGFLAL